MQLSKTQTLIKYLYDRGYRIINGECHSPVGKGKILKGTIRPLPVPYRQFSIKSQITNNSAVAITYHGFLAYQLYGDKYFEKGVVARHKDGNSLNNSDDNIVLGTQKDNAHDITKEVRKQRIQDGIKTKSNITPEIEEQIKQEFNSGIGARVLYKKYNTSLSKMYHIIQKFKTPCDVAQETLVERMDTAS